ncbi:hypothetical protein EGYY_08990 [Eggerthella sp. YY7918]|nr:hypothetical protein EGYY_08990 [Eggerthella sp. YY7918]
MRECNRYLVVSASAIPISSMCEVLVIDRAAEIVGKLSCNFEES